MKCKGKDLFTIDISFQDSAPVLKNASHATP